MAELHTVCPRGELPDGAIRVLDLPAGPVVVRNLGGQLVAMENVCPHRGGPIAEGEVDGDTITCPWHGWSFSLRTGQCTHNPAALLRFFPCRIEGEYIVVEA